MSPLSATLGVVQLCKEFRKWASPSGQVLSTSFAEFTKKFGIMRDEVILKCIMQFVEGFGRPGELAQDVGRNLYCLAHSESPN